MNEVVKEILRRIANPVIFGNIIISICTVALVLATYLQMGLPVQMDGLAYLVFFSTLFLYNFHRLMGVRRIKPEDRGLITGWAAGNQFTLFMLALVGAGGVGIFVFPIFHSQPLIFILLVVLGAISFLYELPVIKYHEKFQRIRNLWVTKIFMITGVWAFTTALLPAINAEVMVLDYNPLLDYNVWLIVAERIMFIFILALCFDARDVEFDQRDGLKTIPILFGQEKAKELYKIFMVLLIILSAVHYFLLRHFWGIGIAMILSSIITWFVVHKTFPRKSDYYYLFVVDGMMIVMFLLLWIFSFIR